MGQGVVNDMVVDMVSLKKFYLGQPYWCGVREVEGWWAIWLITDNITSVYTIERKPINH